MSEGAKTQSNQELAARLKRLASTLLDSKEAEETLNEAAGRLEQLVTHGPVATMLRPE